jgi:hypothetical protein
MRHQAAPSTEQNAAAEIRDACLAWMDEHAKTCDTQGCLEPVGLIAYLVHCLGMSDEQLRHLPAAIVRYDMECRGCGSGRDGSGRDREGPA